MYAHASVGCLHVRPVVNLKTAAGVRQFEAIASEVADLVLEYGGALSGEHGDGLVRSPFMETDVRAGAVRRRSGRSSGRSIRTASSIPARSSTRRRSTSNLRYGPAYRTRRPATFFDYAEYGGCRGAVEMCSGLGACRKTPTGTMCPSFMATRDEAHSTRGRANALRLALAGELGEAGLGDEGVREVLDLCLECRACKAECPVGVDVARMKSEFLAAYWRRRGTPLRARVLGHVDRAGAVGQPARAAVERARAERAGALDRTSACSASIAAARRRPGRTGRLRRSFRVTRRGARCRRCCLFNDTFTNHYNPGIGMAGLDVLERLGYGVDARAECLLRPRR